MTRNLSRTERIRARHLLQELSEHALSVRNAMDPVSGMMAISYEAWASQWRELTRALDGFTLSVMPPVQPEPSDQSEILPPDLLSLLRTYADGPVIWDAADIYARVCILADQGLIEPVPDPGRPGVYQLTTIGHQVLARTASQEDGR